MSQILNGLSNLLLGLDGEPLRDANEQTIALKAVIANTLARGQSPEPARAMAVALQIYNADSSVKLEDADFAMAREAVEKDELLHNMAKAAALTLFTERED